MNRKLLLVPFLSLMAACNAPTPATAPAQPETTAGSTPAATESASSSAVADNTTAPAAAVNALPEGVIIGAPYQLRADRVVTNNDGLVRRQVTYNYPDADFTSAAAMLEAAFKSAGFKPRPQKTLPGGDVVLVFDKSKYGAAYAILKHASDNASAPRSLLIDFPSSK